MKYKCQNWHTVSKLVSYSEHIIHGRLWPFVEPQSFEVDWYVNDYCGPSSSCPTAGLDFPILLLSRIRSYKELWNSWYSLIWETLFVAEMCNLEERHSNFSFIFMYNMFQVDFYSGWNPPTSSHNKEMKWIFQLNLCNESRLECVTFVQAFW